jgi:hypothetical protein
MADQHPKLEQTDEFDAVIVGAGFAGMCGGPGCLDSFRGGIS